ncbi:hypothetical protein ACIQXW_16290 [Lysinibacillus sp. NPDC097162]|uniref:hypothetical protein n=1 Tax=Lysinibacillus sp. NPDC097162 TaxID=3364140 RepID=UPI0038251A61
MNLTIDHLLNSTLVDPFQKAGSEDCREDITCELLLPSSLRKDHITNIFQSALPTVGIIIRMDTEKLSLLRA